MIVSDVGFSIRRLVRTPGFSATVVLILGLGIGVTTALFTVVDALVLRPLPFEDPASLVWIYQDSDDGQPNANSYPSTRDMAGFTDMFTGVASFAARTFTYDDGTTTHPVDTEFVTSNYLDVLGLEPARGRWFAGREDEPGAGLYAVVSWPAWHTLFNADPAVVGRSVTLDGEAVTVVGVGPRELPSSIPGQRTDFWLSISSTPVGGAYQVANLERRTDHWYLTRARLRAGVTVPQAQAAMNVLADRLATDYPELNQGRRITVFSARDIRVHPQGDGTLNMAAGVAMVLGAVVLLIAAANVANLLLVRGVGRARELAVRQPMGAGRRQVASLLLAESVVLGLAGGLAGLALAGAAVRLLERYPPPLPVALGDLAVNLRVMAFGFAVALVTGLGVGLAAAWRAARQAPLTTLQDESRGSTGGRATGRLRGALVGAQVALSLVLLLAAGLVGSSLVRLRGIDPGFNAERLAYVQVDMSRAVGDAGESSLLFRQTMEAMSALPGVEEVTVTTTAPLAGRVGTSTMIIDDAVVPQAGTTGIELAMGAVGGTYFQMMDIPLLRGRLFRDDDPAAPNQVVANEAMALTYWGTPDAVGRRIRSQGSGNEYEVIGVVGDAAVSALGEAPRPFAYRPATMPGRTSGVLLVRARGEAADILGPMRAVIDRMAPTAIVPSLGTLQARLADSLAPREAAVGFLLLFALFALLLATFGLYAVVAFTVRTRTAEIGLRMALGAGRLGIARLVVGQVLRVAGVGMAVGLVLGGFVGRTLAANVTGVSALDPITFVGVPLILGVVAALAAWLPVQRAMAVHPAVALRGRGSAA